MADRAPGCTASETSLGAQGGGPHRPSGGSSGSARGSGAQRPARFFATKAQSTSFQNASMYLGRAFR